MSEPRERWQELCEQVVAERDPKRLTELVAMLDNELEHREAAEKPYRSNKVHQTKRDEP